MGTTSLVHQGVHISFRFDNLRSRVWSLPAFVYRTPVALKQVPVRASLPCTSLHHVSSGSYPYGRFLPIPCARQTEQEDFSASEETEKRTSSEKLDSTQSFPFVGNPNKIGEEFGHDNLSPVRTVALWVCAAVAFGVVLGFKDGIGKASEFFAGYLLEQSLSVDNLFVFVLIFKYFQVPLMYQSRVLSYGIAGAVFFRASLILLGTATLQLFAREEEETDLSNNFVVMTCRRFIPVTTNYDKGQFITIQDGVRKATPLLLTLAVIELSDIAFAVDSIPAVFGITRDPFIVFSSNLFAILGLRSLYTLISGSMSELEYLQPAIGVVLGFIGCKMILDFFGYHVSTEVSLGCVAASLSAGVLLSLMKNSDSKS